MTPQSQPQSPAAELPPTHPTLKCSVSLSPGSLFFSGHGHPGILHWRVKGLLWPSLCEVQVLLLSSPGWPSRTTLINFKSGLGTQEWFNMNTKNMTSIIQRIYNPHNLLTQVGKFVCNRSQINIEALLQPYIFVAYCVCGLFYFNNNFSEVKE